MANESKSWRCGKHVLTFDRPRIMGVLNVTPDSFSDGGKNLDHEAAIAHGLAMLDAGADIIDVGGESTRPGFTPVSEDEESRRVLPVIRALAQAGAIVSVDTRHVEVAKAAVRVGASIVNDVTGFTDPKMVEFVANSTCGVIVVHAGEPTGGERTHKAVQLDTSAAAFVAEMAREAADPEAAGKQDKFARKRYLGEVKIKGGVQQPLPFTDLPNGSDAVASGDAKPDSGAASDDQAGSDTDVSASAKADVVDTAPSSDELAAIMQRAAHREVGQAHLRRFTLPDSAPIMRSVMGFLSDSARSLMRAGVDRDRICLDPGPGFGKSVNEDIVIQRESSKIASLGYPLVCAVSRKRFVGAICGVEDPAERDAATFGACLGAIENGANIVRVHDVFGFSQFLNGYWAVARHQPRRAFISLGSNMGNRMDNIRAARDLIAEIPLTCVFNCSRIYESEPAYETRRSVRQRRDRDQDRARARHSSGRAYEDRDPSRQEPYAQRTSQRAAGHRLRPAVDGRGDARGDQAAPPASQARGARLRARPARGPHAQSRPLLPLRGHRRARTRGARRSCRQRARFALRIWRPRDGSGAALLTFFIYWVLF